MQVQIRDAENTKQWLRKLSSMLHDSLMLAPPEFVAEEQRVVFYLARVGYEYREEGRSFFGLFKGYRMPHVEGRLEINGVNSFTAMPASALDEAPRFCFTQLFFRSPGNLECWMDHGKIIMTVGATTAISYHDTREPVWSSSSKRFGALIISPGLVSEFDEPVDV